MARSSMAEQRPARQHEPEGDVAGAVVEGASSGARSSGTATPGFPTGTASGRGVARLRRPSRSTATHRSAEAGDRVRDGAGGAVAGHDDERVGVDVARARHPLGHRVGHGPPAGAAAQGGRGLELVGAAPRVEVPGAEVGEDLGGGVPPVAARSAPAWASSSPPAASSARRAVPPYSTASGLRSVFTTPPAGLGPAGSAASRCCRTPRWPTPSSGGGPRPPGGTVGASSSSA